MKSSSIKKMLAGLSSAAMIASAMPLSTSIVQAAEPTAVTAYGDANNDGTVSVADPTFIMQALANPSIYQFDEIGRDLGDVESRGDGITASDALIIQKYLAGSVESLPYSWQDNPQVTTTTTSEPTTTTTTTPIEDPVVSTVYIHLGGNSITVDGDTAGYTSVSGSTVTISHSGSYYIDGTLSDGQINVNVADSVTDAETVKLFLNGVNITGKSAPAILVTNAENTSINLVDGTQNYLSDGETAYLDATGAESGEGVIEAKDDLTIKGGDAGTGTLEITANTQVGVSCNNDIKINGGSITVNSVLQDAIKGKTSVTVKSGTVVIDSEGDGIKSSKGNVAVEGGDISIKAGNDAIQAETTIDISGGTVVAGGDRGLTAVTNVNITGGTVVATATDNQAAGVTSANQATMLLNCIDDTSNTDLCWKKANSIVAGDVSAAFTKKYKYALISDASIKAGSTYTLKNSSTGATITHTNNTADSFYVTNSVTTFETVNPAGTGGTSQTDNTSGEYTITLNGSTIETNAAANVASVSNGVLTITQPGVFTVTGNGSGTQIVVNVDKTAYPDSVVELDLAGMSLTNTTNSPIYVASVGDEVQIVAKNGTTNTISDGTSYTNADSGQGAVYSMDDLKFKGQGTLTVNGNAADAIVGKDDVRVYNGTLVVNSVDDGIRGKDSVTIGNADDLAANGGTGDFSTLNLTVNAKTSGDGLKSTGTDSGTGIITVNGGTLNITSYGDGMQGFQGVVVNGGDIDIKTTAAQAAKTSQSGGPGSWGAAPTTDTTSDSDSAKGIKAGGTDDSGVSYTGTVTINGGNFTINSTDDCVHANGEVVLNAGKMKLTSGDDAVHSDTDLYVGGKTAGTDYTSLEVYVTACYEGFEGNNIYQNNGNIYVISSDDGYNVSGGADSSGTGNTSGGWSQGGFGGSSSSSGNMYLQGGIVSVNTSMNDADGFDSNGNIVISGGYYFGNGGDSFDCGDNGNSISRTGGYGFGGLGMGGGTAYDMSTQLVFADSTGKVLATSMSGAALSYSYGDSNVKAYSGGTISGGTNISTLGQPAVYISGTISGGTEKTLGSGSSTTQPGFGW